MRIGRWLCYSSVLLVSLGTSPAERMARAQVLSVTVKSADDVLKQLRSLADVFDTKVAKSLNDSLDKMSGPGALKGLDRARPVVVTLDLAGAPGDGVGGGMPVAAAYVPVTNQGDFLETAKGLGLRLDAAEGLEGVSHKLSPMGGSSPPLFVLKSPPRGYAVFTNVPGAAAKLAEVKPEGLAPSRPGVLLASLRLDRIPDVLKDGILANMNQRGDETRKRLDGEDDATYRGRLAGIALSEEGITSLLRDGREISLDLNINPNGGLTLGLEVDAKPGTAMSDTLAAFASRKSRFRSLAQGTAASLVGILPVADALRVPIREGIKAGRAKADKEKDPEDRRLINLMLDSFEETLSEKDLDGCITLESVDAPAKAGDGNNVVLFGFGLKNSKKVETTLREAIQKKAKAADQKKIAFDHARGDDGTAIHRITIDDGSFKREEFGEPLMFAAFPEGAILTAVGGNGLEVIKKALATLKKPDSGTAKSTPQVGLDVTAARLARLSLQDQGVFKEAADVAFAGPNAGKDQIHFHLDGGAANLRLVLDADLPILRFLAEVGSRQRKRLGGPGAK